MTQRGRSTAAGRDRRRSVLLLAALAVTVLGTGLLTQPAAAATTTQSLTPTADAYVHGGMKTTNYGSSTSLTAYGTPDITSYLRFSLPVAPAGQQLTSAVLRVTSTTIASAGSTDTQQVRLAGNGWSESTVTWNTRPAVSTVLGSLAAPNALAKSYDIPLTATTLRPLLGAATTLAVTGTGTDSFWFNSREVSKATSRPTLVLTFSTTADTSPPTAPTGLTAAQSGSGVALAWTAAMDDVGVTGYDLHRSATAGFTPTASTRIGTATGRTFTDPAPPAGTWYYRVLARDAAGNVSASSNEATVAVALTTTSVVAATADAYVNSSQPTTAAGSYPTLAAYGTPDIESYLRFSLPSAPAGQVLTGVSLGIRTTTLSSAGSVDAQQVHLASDAWTESTITWNTRPTVDAGVLGTLPGGTAVNTAYAVALSPDQLAPLLGSSVSLAVLGTGTDSFWFNAREAAASVRPTLTLHFASSPPDTVPPSSPTGLVATVDHSTVTLTWSPSTDDVAVARYSVYRSTDPDAVPSAGSLVGTSTSNGYTDPGQPVGTAYYRVVASDAAGNTSAPTDAVPATVTTPPDVATVVAFGDVACAPGYTVTTTTCRQGDVAAVVAAADPDAMVALGDLQYGNGTYAEFTGSWGLTFGQFQDRTLPVVGNHEYADPDGPGTGYFDYFYGPGVQTGPFGSRPAGYYATTIGSWQFIALNSECTSDDENGDHPLAGGCGVGSPEYQWLQSTLAGSTASCTLVAFHRPRWTTGPHPSYDAMAPLWDLMAAGGVDVTISGHNHSTEVFQRIGVSGSGSTPVLDPAGIKSFVAGTGGKSHTTFPSGSNAVTAALQARDSTTFGALQLTLRDGSFDWSYLPVAGQSYTNTGGTSGAFSGSNEQCH